MNDEVLQRRASLARIKEAVEKFPTGEYPPIADSHPEHGELVATLAGLGENLRRRFAFHADLLALTARINAAANPEEVLDRVFEEFPRHVPFDRLGIALIVAGGTEARSFWNRTNGGALLLAKGFHAPLAGSSLEPILTTGRPRILNDLEAYLRDHPNSAATRLIVREGIRSNLTCPLISRGNPIGFLFFSSRQANTYQHLHVDTFLEVAANLAVIVEKALDWQRLLELTQTKNRFLGIAAHDLRSPLAVVKSYLEMLADPETIADATRRTYIFGRMSTVTDRMMTLINDLLDLSAIEAGELLITTERLGLSDVLLESLEGARFLGRNKGIEVRGEIPDGLPAVEMDRRRILQVMDNLIGNALKFSAAGTTVTVRATVGDAGIRVSVIDQGKGIPPAEQTRLFQEFGRTSVRPTDGEKTTGLGLAIVRKIIEGHRGKLGVTSEPGQGSTFWFELPHAP